MKTRILFVTVLAVCCFAFPSCSIDKMAMRSSNPEFVGNAIPSAIKKNEARLSKNPDDQELLNSTGSMYVMYANAFVQGPAEQLPRSMYAERQAEMERSRELYLKGLDLLYRGLNLKYPGFDGAFQNGSLKEILAKMEEEDVPALYWSAAAGLSAFSLNPFDMDLGVRIPEFYSLVERAYELDPDFNSGALDEFFLIFHASIPQSMGGDKSKVDIHYQKALEKSNGLSAGTYVSYAQSVSIPEQDYDKFKELLNTALAIDTKKNPDSRLVNVIAQRKARYLLDSASLFFVAIDTGDDWDDWDDED